MAKTSGLACSFLSPPLSAFIDVSAINEAPGTKLIPRLPPCTYCHGIMEPGRNNCRTCGAPA